MAWCVRRSISCGRRRRCRTLIYAALPVSIVGLQDADKVRHAGLIPVIGRDWHLKIWCGLALPKPPHEIGNLLHGAHSERGNANMIELRCLTTTRVLAITHFRPSSPLA